MSAQDASASIVYSGMQNLSVPETNGAGGIYIDLTQPGSFFIPTGSGTGGAEGLNTLLPGWDLNFYKSGGGNLRWAYPGSGVNASTMAVQTGPGGHVAALPADTVIDGSSLLGTAQTMVPEYTSTTAYMGVSFHDGGNNLRYGWIRIAGGPNSGNPATILDWAYEDSGTAIMAGAAPVPEPSTLALGFMSAGAAGLVAWRKNKKK